jgi:RHS repeat-associated protein
MVIANTTHNGIIASGYEFERHDPAATPYWPPLRLPGQYHDEETDLNQNWNRFHDPNGGRYWEPEPYWLMPAKVIAAARAGMPWPVYGYANDNPVAYLDSSGFAVVNVLNSDRTDLALAQCMAAPGCAAALEYLQSSPIVFRLLDQALDKRSPGDVSPAQTGGEGHEHRGCQPTTGTVDIQLDFDQVEANERARLRGSPPVDENGNPDWTPSTHVGTLAHEFFHAEKYVPGTAWGSPNSPEEERAADFIDTWVQGQLQGRGITPY